MMKEKHIGSNFDEFLEEEAILQEVTATAVKRVLAWQIAHEMKDQKMTKTALADKMHTSRAALNRLLDETDTSLTLTTFYDNIPKVPFSNGRISTTEDMIAIQVMLSKSQEWSHEEEYRLIVLGLGRD